VPCLWSSGPPLTSCQLPSNHHSQRIFILRWPPLVTGPVGLGVGEVVDELLGGGGGGGVGVGGGGLGQAVHVGLSTHAVQVLSSLLLLVLLLVELSEELEELAELEELEELELEELEEVEELELELELDFDVELEVGPGQFVTRVTVYAVAQGAMAVQPDVHDQVVVTVAGGSVQPQPAVSVDRMTHGGKVHEAVQTVEVAVTVGQVVGGGISEVMGVWAVRVTLPWFGQ